MGNVCCTKDGDVVKEADDPKLAESTFKVEDGLAAKIIEKNGVGDQAAEEEEKEVADETLFFLSKITDRATLLNRLRQELSTWPPLLSREWSHAKPTTATDARLRVQSFNILADSKQGEEQWDATPPEALAWRLRRWRLLEELLIRDADIICLQELDHVEDFFQPLLCNLGYAVVTQKRKEPKKDAVAVVFRQDRFRLHDKDASLEFAAVVALEECSTARRLVVASCHLAPGKDADSETKRGLEAKQLKVLCENFATSVKWSQLPEGVASAAQELAILIAADMNAEAQVTAKVGEPVAYREMRAGDSGLSLSSAYAALPTAVDMDMGPEPPYTTWKRRPKGEIKRTIDFIFHSTSLLPVSLLDFATEAELPQERVPTFAYPSDHFSLAADFVFVADQAQRSSAG